MPTALAVPNVYIDPHSSLRAIAKGDYVSKVDAKIRRIKETYCKVKHGLPWKLAQEFMKDLVAYVVS